MNTIYILEVGDGHREPVTIFTGELGEAVLLARHWVKTLRLECEESQHDSTYQWNNSGQYCCAQVRSLESGNTKAFEDALDDAANWMMYQKERTKRKFKGGDDDKTQ